MLVTGWAKRVVQLFAWYGQWATRPQVPRQALLPRPRRSPLLAALALASCPAKHCCLAPASPQVPPPSLAALTDTASFQRTPLGVWYLSRQLAQSRLSTA